MRSVMSFRCGGERLVGSLDHGAQEVGLLIVSGGNEIACGPQRAMARLAAMVSDQGFPVFRFDRRGVGDSDGLNGGYESSQDDIVEALKCFAVYGGKRVVAFGNCDAATALALFDLPIAAQLLSNPWLGAGEEAGDDGEGAMPPPAAIRSHYRRRLLDPAAWRALLTGKIDLGKLAGGLGTLSRDTGAPPPLALRIAAGLRAHPRPTRIVIAGGDATGIAFADAWRGEAFADLRATIPLDTLDTDRHGFTGEGDLDALAAILIRTLREVAAR